MFVCVVEVLKLYHVNVFIYLFIFSSHRLFDSTILFRTITIIWSRGKALLCALILNSSIWPQVPYDFFLLGMMEDLLSLIMVIKGATRWHSQVRAGWWSKMAAHSPIYAESSRSSSPLFFTSLNVHSHFFSFFPSWLIITNGWMFWIPMMSKLYCLIDWISPFLSFSARSPVFSAMFEHEMEESKKVQFFFLINPSPFCFFLSVSLNCLV